jgi:nucleoside-diphosphate-sugar epimerase
VAVTSPFDGTVAGLIAQGLKAAQPKVTVTSYAGDAVTDPAIVSSFGGLDAVVYVAYDPADELRDSRGRADLVLRSAQTVVTAAGAAGVRRLIVVSSAMVYGADPDNPVPLDEDSSLTSAPEGTVLGDLLAVESLARAARSVHPGLDITVLRPAVVVGDGIDGPFVRHFEAPRLLVLRGAEPWWQFCHTDDLVAAISLALSADLGTEAAVGYEDPLRQDELEKISGLRHVELPTAVAFGAADRLHRLGVTPTPAASLAFLVHPWAVSSKRLAAAGWRPVYTNETALRFLLEQARGRVAVAGRRLGAKDAIGAAGAAGATVAALGTAVLVRRARRRRSSGPGTTTSG